MRAVAGTRSRGWDAGSPGAHVVVNRQNLARARGGEGCYSLLSLTGRRMSQETRSQDTCYAAEEMQEEGGQGRAGATWCGVDFAHLALEERHRLGGVVYVRGDDTVQQLPARRVPRAGGLRHGCATAGGVLYGRSPASWGRSRGAAIGVRRMTHRTTPPIACPQAACCRE